MNYVLIWVGVFVGLFIGALMGYVWGSYDAEGYQVRNDITFEIDTSDVPEAPQRE